MRYLQIIDNSFIGRFVDRKLQIISSTQTDRIRVENIRSFFNIRKSFAQFLCDAAVKQGLFEKKYGIECPNCERVIMSSADEMDFPDEITCTHCEMLEEPRYRFSKQNCTIEPFYKLVKQKDEQ